MDFPLFFDGAEIEARLCELAEASRQNGALWRASYTVEDARARALLGMWLNARGFSTRRDAAGNQYARLEGSAGGKTVLVGSHLDTVRDAGIYDGAAGIVLGMFALEALHRRFGAPRRPVELVAMQEEEGSRFPAASYFGSRAINGLVGKDELCLADDAGVTLAQALEAAGFPPQRLPEAVRHDLHCYIEPHIEQGGVLEQTGAQLGIVRAITGMALLTVRVEGRPDHAGTTPMDMRRDALHAACAMICTLPGLVRGDLGDTVTVGTLSLAPGSSNVVPGAVTFSVDVRSADEKRLARAVQDIRRACARAAAAGCTASVEQEFSTPPVQLDTALTAMLRESAQALELTHREMVSGAGHDCMHFAKSLPCTMLFLPSRGGRSHCPEEYTAPEQLAYGARVLSHLLYRIAWQA